MSVIPTQAQERRNYTRHHPGWAVLAWNALLAAAVALAASLVLLGRAWPMHASLAWVLVFGVVLVITVAWLVASTNRLTRICPDSSNGRWRALVLIQFPLLALALGGSLSIYLSDYINHVLLYFLRPTPAVVLLLVALATGVAQEAVLFRSLGNSAAESVGKAFSSCFRWAVPISLLLLGLLQGSSYLWIVGNDFTRYWAIADGIDSLSGYIVSVNQGSYIEGGMFRYSIEFPVFPLLLLLSFTLVGHDTLGAHLPALSANTILPLVLYAFYHKAGLARPIAFALACVVCTFPFLRLYTLNAPVPDAVFITILVSAGYALLHLIDGPGGQIPGAGSSRFVAITRILGRLPAAMGRSPLPWVIFGALAALTTLVRAEGLLFAVMMFAALVPYVLLPRLYLAGGVFLAAAGAFSILVISSFGIPWPRNAGTSFQLQNIQENLDWLGWLSLRWYADPFGIPPATFAQLTALLVAIALLGTLWMGVTRWQLSLLPIAAGLHILAVFTISPRVAGADQWFDFFRHISYGLPFAVLPIFLLTQKAGEILEPRIAASRRPGTWTSLLLAVLLLVFAAYELHLLAYPSLTHGEAGRQLLTSDVWVSFHDILGNRYPLPHLPFTAQEGVMMIDPTFEYIPRHLESVKSFFEPFSTLNTGSGTQYELSSLLVVLFGAIFVLGEQIGLGLSRQDGETEQGGSRG